MRLDKATEGEYEDQQLPDEVLQCSDIRVMTRNQPRRLEAEKQQPISTRAAETEKSCKQRESNASRRKRSLCQMKGGQVKMTDLWIQLYASLDLSCLNDVR